MTDETNTQHSDTYEGALFTNLDKQPTLLRPALQFSKHDLEMALEHRSELRGLDGKLLSIRHELHKLGK